MEKKCLESSDVVPRDILLKQIYRNSQMESSENANHDAVDQQRNVEMLNKNTIFKDDDSGSSGSSEDILADPSNTDSNGLNTISINRNHENVGIYLETPVIEENNICLNSHDYEKAKPKRLSDEFLSSDDNDDDTTNTIDNLIEKSSVIVNESEILLNSKNNNDNNFLPILDDTNSSCSNLDNVMNDESQLDEKLTTSVIVGGLVNSATTNLPNKIGDDYSIAGTSSESTVSYNDNDVQSMDAIERRDFEHEQRLTGGRIMKTSSIVDGKNKFKLNFIKQATQADNGGRAVSSDSKCTYKPIDHSTTPTSSRNYTSRLTKSSAKLNMSSSLNFTTNDENKNTAYVNESSVNKETQPCSSTSSLFGENSKSSPTFTKTTTTTTSPASVVAVAHPKIQSLRGKASKRFEIFSNSNSNDSLSSDKSCSTSSNHSLSNAYDNNKPSCSNSNSSSGGSSRNCDDVVDGARISINRDNLKLKSIKKEFIDDDAGNSKGINDLDETDSSNQLRNAPSSSARCQYSTSSRFFSGEGEQKNFAKTNSNASASFAEGSSSGSGLVKVLCGNFKVEPVEDYNNEDEEAEEEAEENAEVLDNNPDYDDGFVDQGDDVPLENDQNDNDFDEETWADCEEGSDEEICTCHNNSSHDEYTPIDGRRRSTREDSIDDLPSKDVDLSSYIQMVSISEDLFLQENNMSPDYPTTAAMQRKRKLNESTTPRNRDNGDSTFGECSSSASRKRMAYDLALTPRSSQTAIISSPSTPLGRRTPRSLIPTRDNPPPELQDWLLQFQRWSHVERLLAVDRLIEHCEPTQVRHMMKVIEPQFQRDFISLLPKELALQVLSYLQPSDLLRAAQTCRSWRFLCDDNLLWKEKCRKAQILTEPKTDKPKRGRAGNMPPISSAWKAAYMRQHIIEMNWRSRPIRDPKILKGHDDHVITCLQFSGNRIVSGSDDNTLKVWSAVSGRCLRTLVGHTGGVWSSQMSGNIIISGSTDRTLKVWDMETGHCVHTLLGHTSTVRCMHLHGKKVVSGSRDATLRVWDIEQGTCLHVLVGHLAAVRCVQYDGKLIVSGAYDYMVKIWHPERQECLHTLQGHTNRVYSLQFDGIHVVSGSLDTSIRVWDVENGNCKHTLMGHQSLTSGMELRQNILVSGNADSTVKVWDITSGQCLQTLSGPNKHNSAVTCLQFNSRFVITSSDDGTVKLWDVKTGEFIRNLVALDSGGSGGVVWRIRANDTKLICAVGSRNGTEETKLMVLDFDVEGACVKCS